MQEQLRGNLTAILVLSLFHPPPTSERLDDLEAEMEKVREAVAAWERARNPVSPPAVENQRTVRAQLLSLLSPVQDAINTEDDCELASAIVPLIAALKDQRNQHRCARRDVYSLLCDALKWTTPFGGFSADSADALSSVLTEVTRKDPPLRGLHRYRRILQRGGLLVAPPPEPPPAE